jgi:hypothetical protein
MMGRETMARRIRKSKIPSMFSIASAAWHSMASVSVKSLRHQTGTGLVPQAATVDPVWAQNYSTR